MVSYVRFVNISEPDQLSEANPLSEEASSPSERRTLENVKSESSVLRDEGIPVINPNVLLIEKEIIPGVLHSLGFFSR